MTRPTYRERAVTAQAMAELMHPDDVAGHLDFYEQVLQALKSRR